MNRWHQLNAREKDIVRRYIVSGEKLDCIAHEIGISSTRITQIMVTVYRILELRDKAELALWVGKNWNEIEKPKIAKVS